METAISVELYQKLRTIIEKGIFVEFFGVFQWKKKTEFYQKFKFRG